MPNEQPTAQPTTIWGSIMSLNPKFVLAFFLIIVAALLVVFFIMIVTNRPPGAPPLDAGTVAVIVGLITTFVLMAKSASDYQFSSSAGSDKKDDAQTAVSKALADKVPAPVAASSAPISPAADAAAVVIPWWSVLTDTEKAGIAGAAVANPKAAAFMVAAQTGKATADDLADLVSKNLLTQDRADVVKAT